MKNVLLTFGAVYILYTITIFFVLFTRYRILITNSLLAPRNNLQGVWKTVLVLVVDEIRRTLLLLPIVLLQLLHWTSIDDFDSILRAIIYGGLVTIPIQIFMKHNGGLFVEAIQNVGLCVLLLVAVKYNAIVSATDWQGWIVFACWCLVFSCFFTVSRVTLAFVMSRNNWYRE